MAITHIHSLADSDEVEQVFFQNQYGNTAIMRACYRSAPVELVQAMITTAKLGSRKMCLLAITSQYEWTALHYAAMAHSSDPSALSLLILSPPLALQTTDENSDSPLQYATFWNRPAAIITLLTDTTNALAASDYERVIGLVGSSPALIYCK